MRELLEIHVPKLRAYVRLRASERLLDRESASDLVQSVCREALEEIGEIEFRGEGAFRQWLYTNAERKIIDRARYWAAERRDPRRETPADERLERAELRLAYRTIATPSQEAAAHDEVERVEGAFHRLPEHYREVIVLARIVGLSHAEIAERLDKTEGAVRMLLMRALAELSEALET